VIASVTPSAITLSNLLLLYNAGDSQHEVAGVKLSGFGRDIDNLLHFRDDLIRFAIVLLVVHATVETRKWSQRDTHSDNRIIPYHSPM
jgi:hypothetical protein